MGDIPITDSVSEDLASGSVASDGYRRHLGFKKGMAIASFISFHFILQFLYTG